MSKGEDSASDKHAGATYWLIERNSKHKFMPPTEPVLWFKERQCFAQGDKDIWTPHADKARHFTTKAEAEQYVRESLTGENYEPAPDVTGHMDCAGPTHAEIDAGRPNQSGLIDGVQFDKSDPATRLFVAANYWREKYDELKASLSAASSVVPPLAYKLRAVLNEYGAFIKHQIIEDAMLDAAVELERIAASSSEGSIVDDIAQLIAGGAGADTSSALPNVDIRWFLETFVKAVDFHGGLGTPSLQRAEAELLYAWATRVLSGPAHDAVSHATTSDEDAALLEMCHGTLRELVNRIEKCGASLELTRAVMLCSDLMMAVGNRWNPRDKDAAQRVRDELARAGTPISASHATTRLPGEMFENGEVRINVDEQWFYRGNRSPSWVYLGRSPNGLPTGIAERVPAECWPLLEHIAELRAPSSATRRNEHGEG